MKMKLTKNGKMKKTSVGLLTLAIALCGATTAFATDDAGAGVVEEGIGATIDLVNFGEMGSQSMEALELTEAVLTEEALAGETQEDVMDAIFVELIATDAKAETDESDALPLTDSIPATSTEMAKEIVE